MYHHHLLRHMIFAQVSEDIAATSYNFIGMLHDMLVLSRHDIIIWINKHTVCTNRFYNTIIYYKAVVYSTLQIYMELMVEILTSLELKLAIFFNIFSIWSQYFSVFINVNHAFLWLLANQVWGWKHDVIYLWYKVCNILWNFCWQYPSGYLLQLT